MATYAALVVAIALTVRLALQLRDSEPEVAEGEVTVLQAINASGVGPFTVRGYAFAAKGFDEVRLCHDRKGGSPPTCVGPFVSLRGAGVGAFDLSEQGDVLWSADTVAVTGTVVGSELQVQSVAD